MRQDEIAALAAQHQADPTPTPNPTPTPTPTPHQEGAALLDFPPLLAALDAHALWHVSTAPIAHLLWRWLANPNLNPNPHPNPNPNPNPNPMLTLTLTLT